MKRKRGRPRKNPIKQLIYPTNLKLTDEGKGLWSLRPKEKWEKPSLWERILLRFKSFGGHVKNWFK